MVYRYLFRSVIVSPASCARAPISKPTRTFIFRACAACYNEARPIFLQTACFSLVDPSSGYAPELQDEMKRMIGAFQLDLVCHLRVPLPCSCDSWSNDLTAPYKNLRTLTIAVGPSHLGAQGLPSEPSSAEYLKETTENGLQTYEARKFTRPPSRMMLCLCRRR